MALSKWYESPLSDRSIIISSRVRLARNLKKYPFPIKLTDESAGRLMAEVVGAVKKETTAAAIGDAFNFTDLSAANPSDLSRLLETHLISPEFLNKPGVKGLLVKDDESVSIMMNEEDHLRIQTIFPGDNMIESYRLANRVDDLIEETLAYAFDRDFGYLTACPTNVGTGLRASLMFHIPALEMTGHLTHLTQSIAKFGMTVRGIYGEGSKPVGSIYQISNQMTIGKTENEMMAVLNQTAAQITEQEEALRGRLFSDRSLALENKIYRSYGILSYCRKISAKEAMPMLSDIRLGFNAGVLKQPRPAIPIYEMMMRVQPGNMQKIAEARQSETERDVFRAAYIQACLKNEPGTGIDS